MRKTGAAPTQSVSTYSYHNVRNDQDGGNGRNIKKVSVNSLKSARKIWAEKFGLIVLLVVIVICLANVLDLSSSPVVILGNTTSSGSMYTKYRSAVGATATKLLSSSILNANKVTVNTSKIESTLEADYPMYSSISLSLPLIDRHPIIYLTPAQPSVVLSNAEGQYLLNDSGQVMVRSHASGSFNYLHLPLVNYAGSGYLNTDLQVLTTSEVQFIQTIVYELSVRNDKISNINLPQGTSELDVYVSGQPYYVKFNLENSDSRQQAGSFIAAQQYLKSQNITPGQYIDVRTDGRVYYQ